jgi:DNA-binding NtrC family response regulator
MNEAPHVLNSSIASPLDVLIVSERPDHLRPLIRTLGDSSARVSDCFTIRQAREIFSRHPVDLVFTDEYLSDGSYRELLLLNRFGQHATGFVLLLRTGEWEEYLDAMRLGALEVLRCPLQPAEVEATLQRAIADKERRSAARLATESLKAAAGSPTQQDLIFEELLGLAAASLSPANVSAASAGASSSKPSAPSPKSGDHRPRVVRRGVA